MSYEDEMARVYDRLMEQERIDGLAAWAAAVECLNRHNPLRETCLMLARRADRMAGQIKALERELKALRKPKKPARKAIKKSVKHKRSK